MACKHHHSQYVYSASTYAHAADFERPKKQTLAPQAAVVLPAQGGHGTNRVAEQRLDGLISFKAAYSEVGGSFDDCHDTYTTRASSVIEGLNIGDMVTADRIISRLTIYYPAHGRDDPSFDITGSYFENLRIAGNLINVKLDTHLLHEYDTYSKLAKAHQRGDSDPLLLGIGLNGLKDEEVRDIEENYHALSGMGHIAKEWKDKSKRPAEKAFYRLSAANQIDFNRQVAPSEVKGYGAIICIPKFGVVRLAEIVCHRHSRTLIMLQVQMCSAGHGTSTGPGSSGSGGSGGP